MNKKITIIPLKHNTEISDMKEAFDAHFTNDKPDGVLYSEIISDKGEYKLSKSEITIDLEKYDRTHNLKNRVNFWNTLINSELYWPDFLNTGEVKPSGFTMKDLGYREQDENGNFIDED